MEGMKRSGRRDGGLGRPPFLRFGTVMMMTMVTTWLSVVHRVEGQSNTQCVQIGQGAGAFTIGGEIFKTTQIKQLGYYRTAKEVFKKEGKELLEETCPPTKTHFEHWDPFEFYKKDAFLDAKATQSFCTKEVEIRVYVVQQDGKTLKGWLHVEVEANSNYQGVWGRKEQFHYIYVQVRDEHMNAIGEFVTDENERCKVPSSNSRNLISPTKYQALPCSATGAREHQTSQALFLARHDAYVHIKNNSLPLKKRIPAQDLTRGIHFTWRMSEYWCSRHQRIRIDALVLTDQALYRVEKGEVCNDIHCKIQRKVTEYWLHPKWYGAADIKTKGGGELVCNKPAIDFETGKVSKEALSWINSKTTRLIFRDDYMNKEYELPGGDTQGCQVNPVGENIRFGGRCTSHVDKVTSSSVFQTCNYNESAEEFEGINITATFEPEDYKEYTTHLKETRLAMCTQHCKVPTTDDDLQYIITNFTYREVTPQKDTVNVTELDKSREDQKRIQVWSARKCHGVTCLIIALFLFPVSNFLSRYYKETFMGTRWYGCAPWFWLHVGACCVMFWTFVTGRRSLHSYYGNWGYSTEGEATTHRILGHLVCFIFLLLSVTGYNRPQRPLFRIIYLFFHALFGFSIYIISIILVITSQNIPMSPSGLGCETNNVPKTGISATSFITIFWVVVDIVFHLIMTAFQILMDKRTKIVRRGFGFPFMTFLPLEYNRDFRGGVVRKIILGLYVGISFVITAYAVGDLMDRERKLFEPCDFGEMSCIRTPEKGTLFGCHQAHMSYFKYLEGKYNFTKGGNNLEGL